MSKNIFRTKGMAFIISFITAAALMSGAICVALVFSKPIEKGDISSISERPFIARRDHEMNILAIGCDWRGGKASSFFLFKINSVERKISICAIPPETEGTVNIKTDTLQGLYDYGGYQYAMEGVSNIFGIKLIKYIRVDKDGFKSFVDLLGGVEYNLPYDVKIKNGPELKKGKQQLDGKRIYEIFASSEQSSLIALRLQTDIIAKAIQQDLSEEKAARGAAIFKSFCNFFDTNITAFDFEYRQDAILHIAKSEEKKANPIYLFGEYINGIFVPDQESITELQSEFVIIKEE